jgi:hypothetical protein
MVFLFTITLSYLVGDLFRANHVMMQLFDVIEVGDADLICKPRLIIYLGPELKNSYWYRRTGLKKASCLVGLPSLGLGFLGTSYSA